MPPNAPPTKLDASTSERSENGQLRRELVAHAGLSRGEPTCPLLDHELDDDLAEIVGLNVHDAGPVDREGEWAMSATRPRESARVVRTLLESGGFRPRLHPGL